MHCPLFADVVLSTEAATIVIAVIAALWAWSVSLVQGRTADAQAYARGLQAENAELRRQNEGLYQQLIESQKRAREARSDQPGE